MLWEIDRKTDQRKKKKKKVRAQTLATPHTLPAYIRFASPTCLPLSIIHSLAVMFVSRIRVTLSGQDVAWLLGSPSMLPSRLGWRIPWPMGLLTGETPRASQPASHHHPVRPPAHTIPSGSQSCRTAPRRHHTTKLVVCSGCVLTPPPFPPLTSTPSPSSPSHLSSFYCAGHQRLGCAGKIFLATAQCPIASLCGEHCRAQHTQHQLLRRQNVGMHETLDAWACPAIVEP